MAPGERKMKIDPELLGFGAEVARHREAAGLNQTQLAPLVNVTRGYIGHVESGRTRCRRDFAVRLDNALDSGTQIADAWDELLENLKRAKYSKYFIDFPKAEGKALMLRAYEERLVYGLFQIESYASYLLNDDEAVRSRIRRQEILDHTPPPIVSVVMDEGVLYREVSGSEVMRAQLEHLLRLSHRDRINIQIAPTETYIRGVRGSFAIATQPDHRLVAYATKAFGGETSTDTDEIEMVSEVFVALQAEALNVRDTRTLIRGRCLKKDGREHDCLAEGISQQRAGRQLRGGRVATRHSGDPGQQGSGRRQDPPGP
ncbi:helix-turn-helix transcriptional regulator [Actinomadura napierensis]|uniref:Helix-turn-helix transcriptional regulator n=1 Tax=Actinomadura napierensis TaxID=267854 RepID=A0ABP5KVU0_9ACTN